jgi:dimethylglycine dehydrogenase
MCGLDRFIDFAKPDFIGREAVLAARGETPTERLVLLEIDALDADVTGYEPIYHHDRRVGYVTSGCYGHHVKKSLALGYIEATLTTGTAALSVTVVGQSRTARILTTPPYDPSGARMRS